MMSILPWDVVPVSNQPHHTTMNYISYIPEFLTQLYFPGTKPPRHAVWSALSGTPARAALSRPAVPPAKAEEVIQVVLVNHGTHQTLDDKSVKQ